MVCAACVRALYKTLRFHCIPVYDMHIACFLRLRVRLTFCIAVRIMYSW